MDCYTIFVILRLIPVITSSLALVLLVVVWFLVRRIERLVGPLELIRGGKEV